MDTSQIEQFLVYFERTVLCHHRVSPDLFELVEDDMGGRVKSAPQEGDDMTTREWVEVRFAFRRLADQRVCVAAFGPGVQKLPDRQRLIWRGHLVDDPEFATDDPAFRRWVDRYLELDFQRSGQGAA